MVKTVKNKSTNFPPLPEGAKANRYKIGKGSKANFVPKETSPGVLSIPIGKYESSRPQNPERMGVGGRKGKAKGRTDPKAADPKDPGPNPAPPSKVNWPTSDANAKKGYVVGHAWPEKSRTSAVHEDSPSVTAPHE